MPALDLQALLKIFIGMHESRRVELFGDLAVRLLHASQDDGVQDEFLPEPTAKGLSKASLPSFPRLTARFGSWRSGSQKPNVRAIFRHWRTT